LRLWCIFLALLVKTGRPFFHRLFILELDGEAFDAGIALPPDLDGV
jgi:hypothetical protein